jgi:hypothetical protein
LTDSLSVFVKSIIAVFFTFSPRTNKNNKTSLANY